ncbi:MAG TPA: hypothetical protein VGI39_39850 [Polyangiaceae bacterium]|jgi:predicted esterase
MADAEFRDDGTIICPVHGLRYDPALSDGCIKCPRKSLPPGQRSQAPRRPSSAAPKGSQAPSRPSAAAPPLHGGPYLIEPQPRISIGVPPVPFEPQYLEAPYASTRPGPNNSNAPIITLMPGPRMRSTRRGLLVLLGGLALAATAGVGWYLRPEGATDWSARVTSFRYGPAASKVGSLFVPSVATERPCPLLVLLDPRGSGGKVVTRFAKRCEEHGWIAVSTDAIGGAVTNGDDAEVALLLEYVRANANVDATRPAVAGFEVASEIACRLALTQPDVFSGAILECPTFKAWRAVGALARPDVRFFLFTRTGDPDREQVLTMRDEMERRGLSAEYDELPGGRQPMERDELEPAFAWLDALHG